MDQCIYDTNETTAGVISDNSRYKCIVDLWSINCGGDTFLLRINNNSHQSELFPVSSIRSLAAYKTRSYLKEGGDS